jgi:hypothetical protein
VIIDRRLAVVSRLTVFEAALQRVGLASSS